MQEIGRAGRDGDHAEVILFYNEKDMNTHEWLISSSKMDLEDEVIQDEILKAEKENRLNERKDELF